MNTRQEKLTCRVKAVNNANKYAMELREKLAPIFTPLVGKKILKSDGSLLAKYADLVKDLDLPSTTSLHVYRVSSNYSLAWTVKTCEFMPPHSCMYHETTVYIGNLEGTTLKSMSFPQTHRTDYTPNEIETLRITYEEIKRQADIAKDDLYPFGITDN